MEKITFRSNKRYTFETGLMLPIPDSYHCGYGKGENGDWRYIVPENYSLDDNHIEARPFSFAVSHTPAMQIPDSAMDYDIAVKTEGFAKFLVSQGAMDPSVRVATMINSPNCAFMYQNWVNKDDRTWNKVNGFLIAKKNIYQFHVYANYDEEISCDENTITEFLKIAEKWMKHVKMKGDEKTRSNSENVVKYTTVTPSDELYSHYGHLKRKAESFAGLGVQVVQNNGEEFQALDLVSLLEDNGNTGTNVYRKLTAAMAGDQFDLDQIALKMAQIFRVNESKFDFRHDDECDIRECLMDKKWKLSALRSFAWTIADLANREGKSIDD